MLFALARLIEWLGSGRSAAASRPEDDTWDAAFAEARRRFPADRFVVEVDALAELQRRANRGERRHDA